MRVMFLSGVLWLSAAWSRAVLASPDLLIVTEPMPVFQQIENGEIAGTNTKLVRQVIEAAGLSADFQMYPWARAYNLALTQPNVLIYATAKTAERQPLFHWIGPLASFQLGLVRLKNNSKAGIKHISQARDLTIAVQRQDSTYDFLLGQGFVEEKQLVAVANAEQSWSLLANHKVDLIVENPVLLPALAQSTGWPVDAFEVLYLIPELELQAYLAASKSTDMEKVKKLQQAYQQVTKR